MTDDAKKQAEADLAAATRAFRRAEKVAEKHRTALADVIRRAAAADVRQADLARITGYTRERIFQIVHGDRKKTSAAGHDAVS
jgi:CRP-like cAMP-binding protein